MVALHMLRSSGVKSSRPAVGVGWVTTGVSSLASVWRGLGGVSLRIARFGACWRDTSPWGSSPPVEGAVSAWDMNGDPRHIARFASCWRGTGRSSV